MKTVCIEVLASGTRCATAAVALVAAVTASFPATAAEVPYQGVAALCAVESPGVTNSQGEITYTSRMVMIFRIETDHALINGNERLESNSRLDAVGGGYYWGYGRVVPDIGGGALEGEFFFRSTEMTTVTFSYHGTGDLSGVIMNYRLTPTDSPQRTGICGETLPLGGYLISGTVENYRDS